MRVCNNRRRDRRPLSSRLLLVLGVASLVVLVTSMVLTLQAAETWLTIPSCTDTTIGLALHFAGSFDLLLHQQRMLELLVPLIALLVMPMHTIVLAMIAAIVPSLLIVGFTIASRTDAWVHHSSN